MIFQQKIIFRQLQKKMGKNLYPFQQQARKTKCLVQVVPPLMHLSVNEKGGLRICHKIGKRGVTKQQQQQQGK